MSTLDNIRSALEPFGKTYYGNANPDITEPWDYTVFRRIILKKSTGGCDFVKRYAVVIVRENFIAEGLEFEVINSVKTKAGLRLADEYTTYNYTYKGATDLVVEICLIIFAEPLKGCHVI